jgi:hypothetical protein
MVVKGAAFSAESRRRSQPRRKGVAIVTNALSSYDIALHVSPATGELRAKAVLDELFSADASELSFLLHRSLRAVTVTGDDVLGVNWDESKPAWVFAPESALLTVRFSHPVTAGDRRRLTFVYSGRPGILGQWETNRLTEDWVELGLYLPWFPRRTDEQFTYRVSVTSDQNYDVVLKQSIIDKRNRAGKRAFLFELSEDLPKNWEKSIPVVLEALNELD